MLAKGLDINAVDTQGWTALDYLNSSQLIDRCAHCAEVLLHRGLNPDI